MLRLQFAESDSVKLCDLRCSGKLRCHLHLPFYRDIEGIPRLPDQADNLLMFAIEDIFALNTDEEVTFLEASLIGRRTHHHFLDLEQN